MLAKNLHRSEAWWKIPIRIMLDFLSAFKGLLAGDAGYCLAILKAHAALYTWLFSKAYKRSAGTKRMNRLAGVYLHAIVWKHFVRKKNRFSEIVNNKQKN